MPILVYGLSALGGLIAGIVYEKESNKKVVEAAVENKNDPGLNFWDKLIMAAAGVAAYWIYKRAK